MTNLPSKALSVRQPWAWSIIHAGKPLENRSWALMNHCKKFRGPVCIHAAGGMTRDEYESAKEFMAKLGAVCPAPDELVRGAIIGTVNVTGWVTKSINPWFMGPGALVLENPAPLPEPIPAGGMLGFFDWHRSDQGILPAAKWMLPKKVTIDRQPDPLFPLLERDHRH